MGRRGGGRGEHALGLVPRVLGGRCHSFLSEGLKIGPSSGQGRRPREGSTGPREAGRP